MFAPSSSSAHIQLYALGPSLYELLHMTVFDNAASAALRRRRHKRSEGQSARTASLQAVASRQHLAKPWCNYF